MLSVEGLLSMLLTCSTISNDFVNKLILVAQLDARPSGDQEVAGFFRGNRS